MEKEVMILTGAGQIGMAIARRMGYGMKIVVGDKRMENAQSMADTMNPAHGIYLVHFIISPARMYHHVQYQLLWVVHVLHII